MAAVKFYKSLMYVSSLVLYNINKKSGNWSCSFPPTHHLFPLEPVWWCLASAQFAHSVSEDICIEFIFSPLASFWAAHSDNEWQLSLAQTFECVNTISLYCCQTAHWHWVTETCWQHLHTLTYEVFKRSVCVYREVVAASLPFTKGVVRTGSERPEDGCLADSQTVT